MAGHSGSMKSKGKIQGLREAAVNMVDLIYGDAETRADTWIGIAPFSGRVNVVDYGTDWIQGSHQSGSDGSKSKSTTKSSGSGWNGKLCTGVRSAPNDRNDAPHTTEMFPLFTYDQNVCPEARAIGLTASKSTIRNALLALDTGHGTCTQEGMAWGWRMVSHRWQGQWGSESLPLSHADSPGKYVVIMTDGANHPSQSGDGFSVDVANQKLLDTCAGMKAEGITIFSVAFDMGGSPTDLYRQCASKPDYHFDAESNVELNLVFGLIGDALTSGSLRLVE